ncbi:MAG: hypothetical protein AAFU79_32280 [Myxococcota bacterium]
MVRRGEYLERAVVIPGEPPLEGLYHRGSKRLGAIILPAEPAAGGMEVPLVAELAWAVTRAGHPTLRFNYPGVGASPGDWTEAAAKQAVGRAVEHLRACLNEDHGDRAEVAHLGVGLGGVMAVEAAQTSGEHGPMVLVQPPSSLESLTPPLGEVIVVSAGDDPEELRSLRRRWASTAPQGRAIEVPGADSAWLRHLSIVGQVAAELLTPPGLIDLEA